MVASEIAKKCILALEEEVAQEDFVSRQLLGDRVMVLCNIVERIAPPISFWKERGVQ
jgi:hypothetical protein